MSTGYFFLNNETGLKITFSNGGILFLKTLLETRFIVSITKIEKDYFYELLEETKATKQLAEIQLLERMVLLDPTSVISADDT